MIILVVVARVFNYNSAKECRRDATSYNIGIDFTGSFAGCFNSFGYGYNDYFFKNIAVTADSVDADAIKE